MTKLCEICGREMEIKRHFSQQAPYVNDILSCPATPDQHRIARLEHEVREKDEEIQRLELKVSRKNAFLSKHDCRHAGDYYELSGSHCPIGDPCDRCWHESQLSAAQAKIKEFEKLPTLTCAEHGNCADDPACGKCFDAVESERDDLKARNEELEGAVLAMREALERFGKHDAEMMPACPLEPCTCGLSKALTNTTTFAQQAGERIERKALEKAWARVWRLLDYRMDVQWSAIGAAILGTQKEKGKV